MKDKTRFRYVLYRAAADPYLLRLVLRLIPRHPEHADACFSYLSTFGARKPIARLCLDLIHTTPYPYVRGEAWWLLTGYLEVQHALALTDRRMLIDVAVKIARRRRSESFTETLGACAFLAASEKLENKAYSQFLKRQSPLLQALAADMLPATAFCCGKAADSYLHAKAFEPGISICGQINALKLGLATFNILPGDLPTQVQNTLRELGAIPTSGEPVDPIAEVLERRYGVEPSKSWRDLLGAEYVFAMGLLKQAEAAFYAARSHWLAMQNSFHHAVFLALQRHLCVTHHAAACTVKGRDGRLVDFGVMLDIDGPFARHSPAVAKCFRDMNARRNHLPASHPYEKKTERRSRALALQEQKHFVRDLGMALPILVKLMP